MRIVTYIIDLLFHPRATEKLLRTLDALPVTGQGTRDTVTYLARYKDTVVHAAITENKYYANRHATFLLSNLLRHWRSTQAKKVVFIPIPLSKKRLKERGYNQVTQILSSLQNSETIILESVLTRIVNTAPQTSLSGTERQKNVRGAFAVSNPEYLAQLSDVIIVLVDDVLTTGATMHEARATLAPHVPLSCQLLCLTLAH